MKRKATEGDGDGTDTSVMTGALKTLLDVSGHDLSSKSTNNGDGRKEVEYFDDFFRRKCLDVGMNVAAVEALDVSRCRLGPNGVSNLLFYLSPSMASLELTPSSLSNLRRLILQRNAIGSEGGRTVGRFLGSHDMRLEELDISLNDIKAGGGEPTAAKVISDALLTNSSLRVLIMEKCAVGPEGATHLAGALGKNKHLQTLELAGNMIGPVGGEHLFCALKTNSSLKQMGLKMNRIGGCDEKADVHMLSNALSGGYCQLTKLDLSYNDLRCSGCRIISQALTIAQCTLEELVLEKNDISENGAVALADALASNVSLKKLVLIGNSIGVKGAIAIGKMMRLNKTLTSLDLSSCSIGNEGGVELGRGLAENPSIQNLMLKKNSLGSGNDTTFFSSGISTNKSLQTLNLSGNNLAMTGDKDAWEKSIADALSNNSTLQIIDLSNNALSDPSIIDAVAIHSSIEHFDLSDNIIENISIETQLLLAKRLSIMEMDLSLNPLCSPPLGRLANYSNLKSYLSLLASEKTAVTRIRLMVLGYGGVGKSTFCRAVTSEHDASDFQSTLVPVQEWDSERLADWAGRLGTSWSGDAVRLIVDECITGKDLTKLIDYNDDGDNSSNFPPSDLLINLCSSKYPSVDGATFAKAISALTAKGYLSTVGAVKVEGNIDLSNGTSISLVDFAGQVEFLVSHQLLLSSMHTLCMVIQPAPSFGKPDHRHFGSWDYWSKFLSSLGDRRQGSLVLAVSQLDKLAGTESNTTINGTSERYIQTEFSEIKGRAQGAISCDNPLKLDYTPAQMAQSKSFIKAALSKSLEQVAHSWWVPKSYEALAHIMQRVANQKSSSHELPILTKNELIEEIVTHCDQTPDSSLLLEKMKTDGQLLQRAIHYLEAVGDVMQVGKEWLLADPIGWFSSFLAHFIKDDLAVSTLQLDAANLRRQRGTVGLKEIVHALKHDYKSPHEHISQIMMLLCGLELCVPLKSNQQGTTSQDIPISGSISYLFPCLLPPLESQSELENCGSVSNNSIRNSPAVRGHRFRESSGFIPPGLFVGILARMYRQLKYGIMQPERMWKDHAVLVLNHNTTHVLLRCDLDNAVIDIIAWAPESEQLFVGAAKGQASIVTWLGHVIKMFLRSYTQLQFEESWLCPSSQCHGLGNGCKSPSSAYTGSEFLLSSTTQPHEKDHDCDVEGCFRFLGNGHNIGRAKRRLGCVSECQACKKEPVFALRENV